MFFIRVLFALIALFALNAAEPSAPPPLKGETLAGRKVDLRKETAGKPALILFAFAKDSMQAMKPWTERLAREFPDRQRVALYNVANIQKAPFFLRGLIKGGMRSDVSLAMQDRFLVTTNHDKDWRQYLQFDSAHENDAYLLVLDATGKTILRKRLAAQMPDTAGVVGEIREAIPIS